MPYGDSEHGNGSALQVGKRERGHRHGNIPESALSGMTHRLLERWAEAGPRRFPGIVREQTARGIGRKAFADQGAGLDAEVAHGGLARGSFAASAEAWSGWIAGRVHVQGCIGRQPFGMATARLHLPWAAKGRPGTEVGDLCAELGASRQMPCRRVNLPRKLDPGGVKLLGSRTRPRQFRTMPQTRTSARSPA